jgi:hypothetical protein
MIKSDKIIRKILIIHSEHFIIIFHPNGNNIIGTSLS